MIAGGAITWTNAVAMASGRHGGWIELRSLGADVTVAGSILARSEFFSDYGAANVQLEAAGQLDFTGTLDIGTDQPDPQPSRQARLIAGQTLTIHSGSLIEGRDAASLCTHFGPSILLEGCRIVVESSAAVFTCGAWGTAIDVHVRDTFTSDGTLASGPAPGGIFVTSRLPWAYALQGTGSMTPAPQVTVNPDLLPCLGAGTQIIAPSSLTPGQTLSVTVISVPNKPILAVANTAIAHLSLDAFGWTQVNPFTAFVLADHVGLLGPAVAGATGATGIWTWTHQHPGDSRALERRRVLRRLRPRSRRAERGLPPAAVRAHALQLTAPPRQAVATLVACSISCPRTRASSTCSSTWPRRSSRPRPSSTSS